MGSSQIHLEDVDEHVNHLNERVLRNSLLELLGRIDDLTRLKLYLIPLLGMSKSWRSFPDGHNYISMLYLG